MDAAVRICLQLLNQNIGLLSALDKPSGKKIFRVIQHLCRALYPESALPRQDSVNLRFKVEILPAQS